MITPEIVLWDGKVIHKDAFIQYQEANAVVVVQYNVTLKEVRQKDYTRIRVMLDSFCEAGEVARQSLLLCFDGWDFDERCLAQIPEVVAYIRRTVELYPHLWYFLLPEANQHVAVSLITCTLYSSPLFPKLHVAPHLPPSGMTQVELDIPAAERLLASMTEAVTAYGVLVGDERGARAVVRAWRDSLNM